MGARRDAGTGSVDVDAASALAGRERGAVARFPGDIEYTCQGTGPKGADLVVKLLFETNRLVFVRFGNQSSFSPSTHSCG